MRGRRQPFRERVEFLIEHFALFALAIGESILLSLVVIGGILLLSKISTNNPIIELMVEYDGIEGVVIFILSSISLIRDIFVEEYEEEPVNGEQGV